MKQLLMSFIVLSVVLLSSCTTTETNNIKKDFVLNEIDFYMENNNLVDMMFDTGLADVEDKIIYRKTDFFNYDLKDTKNVDVEYDEYYEAFNTLFLVKHVLGEMEVFEYDTCFNAIVNNEKLCINYVDNVLQIDYYEYIVELDIIISHRFDLTKQNDKAIMTKYTRIYDNEEEVEILSTKLHVYGYDYFVKEEYYPETDSFVYENTNYLEQTYFMYKGVLNEDLEFIRQTVEMYIPGYNAYVSYDIKEDTLEDYRVKLFSEGHRVLKVDVNIKQNNPTVNELTWNLLSIDGWGSVDEVSKVFYVYQGSFETMEDYYVTVQLNGYGKVNAYKLFSGSITNEDITLVEYDMNSGYTLDDIETARLFFSQNYVHTLESYGFTSNNPENRFVVNDDVYIYDNDFEEYAARFN